MGGWNGWMDGQYVVFEFIKDVWRGWGLLDFMVFLKSVMFGILFSVLAEVGGR